ncbi:unnamed protein product [Prorocentrum cordatum]|uniref:Uncharacterized protein n=1 Tax=Prorocentrum cordatum TaxID=2364126 RepID=A0ABN9RJ61_9DINO|nr:unnamed protein product [Polarella glacialis]
MDPCQYELHQWDKANQMTFDANKESNTHFFQITMTDLVLQSAKDGRWKLKAILKTRKYNAGAQLVLLRKAQVLSFIEYRTAAIYHTCKTALEALDHVQDKLTEAARASKEEALLAFKLAPLSSRRDIAMFGLIHRSVLGRDPGHFKQLFKLDTKSGASRSGRRRL